MLFEGFPGEGGNRLGALGHGFGEDSDFILSVVVESEGEEMEEIVEIDLPIPLGIEGEWQVVSGDFSGEALFDHLLIVLVDGGLVLLHFLDHGLGVVEDFVVSGLFVVGALAPHFLDAWDVEFVLHDGISAADFIESCGSMSDPLSCNEDGHFAVEGELDLFEGRGVFVSEEIVDEASVLSVAFCS